MNGSNYSYTTCLLISHIRVPNIYIIRNRDEQHKHLLRSSVYIVQVLFHNRVIFIKSCYYWNHWKQVDWHYARTAKMQGKLCLYVCM